MDATEAERKMRGWAESVAHMRDAVRCLLSDMDHLLESGPPTYLIPPEQAEINRRVQEQLDAVISGARVSAFEEAAMVVESGCGPVVDHESPTVKTMRAIFLELANRVRALSSSPETAPVPLLVPPGAAWNGPLNPDGSPAPCQSASTAAQGLFPETGSAEP